MDYQETVEEIIDCAQIFLSDIKPSDWNEKHRVLTSDVSPFPGKFSYDRTPYFREIVDCFGEDHAAKIVVLMKGAQLGASTCFLEAAIGWIIGVNPGNILFLTGHADLADEAMTGKIDNLIANSGLTNLIRPNILKKKNQRTGDTSKSKEFPGGSLTAGNAGNHKLLRQRSVRYAFIDDFDAAKQSTRESGSTTKMIEQRLAAYYSKMKLAYISTPELKQTSNIEPLYELGDKRRYFIPCPCCGELISLHWEVEIEGTKDKGGITWKLDDNNKLIKDSVGYICQKCTGFFTDDLKYDLNLRGEWRPTAEPQKEGYYSYHLSSLYAASGMYNWYHYVGMYLEACPPNTERNEELYKTFRNLCLGETYEETGDSPKANQLQKNIRNYDVGIIPERVSISDGNGQIVLLTCSCDLNGREDDARLDWEVVAWSETGSSYSIKHGSIGTFIPREGSKRIKTDRERWTYVHGRQKSVWPEFQAILDDIYITDKGRKMSILISGVDTGHYTKPAYEFIDRTNSYCVGLKGKDVNKKIRLGTDLPTYKKARERKNLLLVEVNQVKDDLARTISLKWDPGHDEKQPHGFMNFPTPSDGLYLFENFFEHYESEHRIMERKSTGVTSRWVKVNSVAQNHLWDVRVYGIVLKDIVTDTVCKEYEIKNGGWDEFVQIVLDGK